MKQRKRIGVITSEIESVYNKKLIHGIQKEASKLGYDVLVFSTFLQGKMWDAYFKGELNIFSLINFEMLDGIIVDPDGLLEFEDTRNLVDYIEKEYQGAVVSIGDSNLSISNVVDDTETQIHYLWEHLYSMHGVRDFAFMSGPEEHPHANTRKQAFLSFLKEKDISLKEHRIYYGDFWYHKGEEVVEALLNSPEGLPEAICCASETMGISVYEALIKRNIRVPEDVRVIGFDAKGGGIVKPGLLTSTCRDPESMGINAVRIIFNCIENTDSPMQPYGNGLQIGCSCGCEMVKKAEKSWESLLNDSYSSFNSQYNFMMEDGIAMKDMKECLAKIDYYRYFLGDFTGYYICLCNDWLGDVRDDNVYRTSGYSEKMNLMSMKYGEKIYEVRETLFPKEEMLPMILEEREKPSTFFFTSLHFMDRCFGYFVIQYEDKLAEHFTYYDSWIRAVCNIFEALRRYINLEKINNTLNETYQLMRKNAVTDALTGLFNRNGFQAYVNEQIEQARKVNKPLYVIMADLNDLKVINDTYGHSEGDYAIIQAAHTLLQFINPLNENMERCYRMGGDEFAAICVSDMSEEELESRVSKMKAFLMDINRKSGKPYQISISFGISKERPEGNNPDKLMQEADKQMYEQKQLYKKEKNQFWNV